MVALEIDIKVIKMIELDNIAAIKTTEVGVAMITIKMIQLEMSIVTLKHAELVEVIIGAKMVELETAIIAIKRTFNIKNGT